MKKIIGLIVITISLLISVITGCLESKNNSQIEFKINYFIAEPSTIYQGEYVNLSWNVSGADMVSIDQGIGITSFSGKIMVQPLSNITYSLSAKNNSNFLNKIVTIIVLNQTHEVNNGNESENKDKDQNETIDDNDNEEENTQDDDQTDDSNPYAIIYTSLGTIKVKLFLDKLPITCNNFINLAKNEFYEGLIFHRVKDDFMIQGGTYALDGEIKESPYGPITLETHQDVHHVDGAISMARSSDLDSATSGFFICDGPQYDLDGEYAAFGFVVEGIEVVHAIASVEHDGRFDPNPGGGEPLDPIIIKSITIQKQLT